MKEKVTLSFNGFSAFVAFMSNPQTLRLDQINVQKNGSAEGVTFGDIIGALNGKAEQVVTQRQAFSGPAPQRQRVGKREGKKTVALVVKDTLATWPPGTLIRTADLVRTVLKKTGKPPSRGVKSNILNTVGSMSRGMGATLFRVKRGLYALTREEAFSARRSLGQKNRSGARRAYKK